MLLRIPALMSGGAPVAVIFSEETGERSTSLYCELIQKARYGESFLIKEQGCTVGGYVLGETNTSPVDYYLGSGRYKDRNAAIRAVSSIKRLKNRKSTIKITPYSDEDFDILILFLIPERAMRLIHAYTYSCGDPARIRTGGIASVCSDCTAYPMQGKIGISMGCKGSRKHTGYADEELVVGIPFSLVEKIDSALEKIPETHE